MAKILVADDSAATRGFIALHLRKGGFKNIDMAANGCQALDAIRLAEPELIITDLVMPNMGGLELCAALRDDPRTCNIPVLVQTGSTDPDMRAQAFASGATDLLTKPFDPRELLYRVRIHLERGRLIERLSEFRRRVADELRQAAAIQEALLPSEAILDQVKENCPVDLAALYEASVGLGGDIWGIDLIGDQRVMIFNADFVGHGLSAALNTVRLHSFINRSPEKPDTPAMVLTQLNKFLCDVLPIGQFATMFCGFMDFKAHTLEYASAAAPPSLLRSAEGEPFHILDEPGFPLGVTRDATYDNCTARFSPGAMLLLFSDALFETPPPPDSAFTVESLAEFVASLPPMSDPHVLRDRVLKEFFSRIAEKPEDDLTLIAAHHMIWER